MTVTNTGWNQEMYQMLPVPRVAPTWGSPMSTSVWPPRPMTVKPAVPNTARAQPFSSRLNSYERSRSGRPTPRMPTNEKLHRGMIHDTMVMKSTPDSARSSSISRPGLTGKLPNVQPRVWMLHAQPEPRPTTAAEARAEAVKTLMTGVGIGYRDEHRWNARPAITQVSFF